jgi:acyl-CoA thioester hydrolase
MGAPLRHRLRVRYADCDMQGRVFNANYLAYFDDAITELARAAFGGYEAMRARGVDLLVAHAELDFHAGAGFDSELDLELWVARLGRTSMITRQRISERGEAIVTGELCHVFCDARTMTKIEIPRWARDALAPFVGAPGGAVLSRRRSEGAPAERGSQPSVA